MKTNGWLKCFTDHTTESGTDELVQQKLASWSRGRLEGLAAVQLFWNNHEIQYVADEGEYWQSDDMVAVYGGPGSTTLAKFLIRRLGRKINTNDIGKVIWLQSIIQPSGKTWFVSFSDPSQGSMSIPNEQIFAEITDDMVDEWVVAELNSEGNCSLKVTDKRP